MVTDGNAGAHQVADLVPVHVAAQPLVHRIGGDEKGEGKARRLEARPSFGVDREVGVVDGKGDGAIGKRRLVAERGDDLGQRQNVVLSGSDLGKMRLELFDADIGGGDTSFAEAVIHEDHGRIASGTGRRRRNQGESGGKRRARTPKPGDRLAHGYREKLPRWRLSSMICRAPSCPPGLPREIREPGFGAPPSPDPSVLRP
jgi:hypothetical protein